ncbi:hypothetical protein [Paracoccus benzoatiresistens]|uniref:Uncharacterized protein n=1 Tax=Paracoccus benzoatiresistens TaxID=2997341 RepID=A0ABT4JCA3_9RHOB|nr:hypothetical protein [Paracoccus sp. EF6]MCZ0964121.1 hypothetical protein [Paracoccus sp. EF6]
MLPVSARSWQAFPPDSALAKTSHQLLAQFEDALDGHREHLARLLG